MPKGSQPNAHRPATSALTARRSFIPIRSSRATRPSRLMPRRSRRRARSSPPSTCRRTTARAWLRSTVAWWSACMPTWRAAPWQSRRRSRRGLLKTRWSTQAKHTIPGEPTPLSRMPPRRISSTGPVRMVGGEYTCKVFASAAHPAILAGGKCDTGVVDNLDMDTGQDEADRTRNARNCVVAGECDPPGLDCAVAGNHAAGEVSLNLCDQILRYPAALDPYLAQRVDRISACSFRDEVGQTGHLLRRAYECVDTERRDGDELRLCAHRQAGGLSRIKAHGGAAKAHGGIEARENERRCVARFADERKDLGPRHQGAARHNSLFERTRHAQRNERYIGIVGQAFVGGWGTVAPKPALLEPDVASSGQHQARRAERAASTCWAGRLATGPIGGNQTCGPGVVFCQPCGGGHHAGHQGKQRHCHADHQREASAR